MVVKERELHKIRKKNNGRTVVFAIGTFDLLHKGHIDYLEWCSQLGDVLVVAVNSDERTKNRKGADRPVFDQAARLRIVDALKMVDYTVLVEDTRAAYEAPIKTAKLLAPDKIGIGNDQSPEYVESWQKAFLDIDVLINPCPKPISTSDIVDGLRGKSARRSLS